MPFLVSLTAAYARYYRILAGLACNYVSLVTARKGDGAERSALKEPGVTIGSQDNIYFADRPNRKATLAEFDQCDLLFCLPSWAEAFGIAYVKTMAQARPIIRCYNYGPADFVISVHDAILVFPNSPSSLADPLSLLCDDPDRLSAIGAALPKKAEMLTRRRNASQTCYMPKL